MGKASRHKRHRTDFDRARKAQEQTLSRFLVRAGVTLPSSSRQLWSNIENKLGSEFADDFDAAIQERAANNALGRRNNGAVYDLMYRDLMSALATVPFVTPMLRTWALHFQALSLPPGPLLDLGSGNGLLTCFYASVRPDTQVTGVELHPGGVSCGEALAEQLGLSNVTFVQGDALSFAAIERFSVVTSVAGLIEMEGEAPEAVHPFSSLLSASAAWGASESALARSAHRVLGDDGVFVSMERISNFCEFARWVSSIQQAGLSPDLDASAHLSWNEPPNGQEAMPAVCSVKQQPPQEIEFNDLVRWYREREPKGYNDFLVELELFEAPSLTMAAGKHFDVEDELGRGQTRIYLIERESDVVMYMSTSRGMRGIISKGRDVESLITEFQSMVFRFSSSPEIVGVRELSAEHLEAELGRPVQAP